MADLVQLNERVFVHADGLNVGIVRCQGRALLIDCGDGSVRSSLEHLGIGQIDALLFTHHHRDSASGVAVLAGPESQIGVPDQERACFDQVEQYWANPKHRWHLYDYHPHNLMLAASVAVGKTYREGDRWHWNGVDIAVLDTPGHTDGSISYAVQVDEMRVVFCGDAIAAEGQVWELYSLQKGGPTRDYHAFLGARQTLEGSLAKIGAAAADILVPTHGHIMRQPQRAIETLEAQLEKCYDQYVAISALRHYFPHLFAQFEGREGHMPIRSGLEVPDFLHHFGTTWVVVAQNGEALVMDCGNRDVLQRLEELEQRDQICGVSQFWITHYHDDHVDAAPAFQARYSCRTLAMAQVARVVERPLAFRLPCISPAQVRIDHCPEEGESWTWNEFKLTAYFLPGQTYYHGGLLVAGRGLRLFFAGDSFTMAGIDDYCSGNRNLLGPGVGYDRCLALIGDLRPTHLFNCHVDCAFAFDEGELTWMRRNLAQRESSYTALCPWDHANYGLDEHWVRCYPYEQEVEAGDCLELRVEISNHSTGAKKARGRLVVPLGWAVGGEQETVIEAKGEGHMAFVVQVPPDALAGRVVVPVELVYDGRRLGQFREAIIVVR